jgi:outer membrane protein
MQVQEAYFAAQATESVRKTAQAVLDFRRVTLRQLTALAQSQLRSALDVQFAQVMVSEAELAVVRAESNVQKAQAELATSMEKKATPITHSSMNRCRQALTPILPVHRRSTCESARSQGLTASQRVCRPRSPRRKRPEFPDRERMAAGGEVPIHDSTIHRDYGAVGFNINIPIFIGGQYTARAAEAQLEAKAAVKDASLREVEIVQDVRMTWADARDAYLQIDTTRQLADEANVAMRLAQARYDAGLGSIVELNQAALNQTSALITAASARFDYLRSMTAFQFALGDLH